MRFIELNNYLNGKNVIIKISCLIYL